MMMWGEMYRGEEEEEEEDEEEEEEREIFKRRTNAH